MTDTDQDRLEDFITQPSTMAPLDPIVRTNVLAGVAALHRIEALLAAQQSAVLDRELAANYLGIGVATLDQLAAANPKLRPVRPSGDHAVWRKEDLVAFLESLEP